MKHVIEAYDCDGTVANSVKGTIESMLPQAVMRHERVRKAVTNMIFVMGDVFGAGKRQVENEVMLEGLTLNAGVVKVLRRHQEEGAEILMLTANGHSEQIEKIMSENGVRVDAIHCSSSKKADFVRGLIEKNPGKRVVSINDSPVEAVQSFAKGLRGNSILFSGEHNFISARLMGALRITKVAKAETIDKSIRSLATA
ncbi:MAG: hypothetical protein ABSC55_27335 [Syntrophorhabdales bacterium]|jgi:hypothetical protein